MKQLHHGGDIYSKWDLLQNKRIIDFSANINPLGMPPSVKNAIIENIDSYSSYPDPLCRSLINVLSRHERVPTDYIVCGNGAADIIHRIAIAIKPKKVLLTAPTFSEYENAVRAVDAEISYHYLHEENGFILDKNIFNDLLPDVDIFFLCNPNNPTGIPVKKELVLEIATHCRKHNTLLVVDESFIDFMQNSEQFSIVKELRNYDNVVVLKAFTKIYAMAGIRLGYGICSRVEITDKLINVGQPWSVSAIAQTGGIAALNEAEFVEQTKALIQTNRDYLIKELSLLGLRVFDSHTNYILFKIEDREMFNKLLPYGILIRACGNFIGLDDSYYRIAVKSARDNEYLIQCLKQELRN